MYYENYKDYLESPEWRQKAKERAAIDDYKCTMCGASGTMTNPLQCHHFHYKTIFREDIWKDLLTLCKNCHMNVHRMMERQTDQNGRKGWRDNLTYANHAHYVLESEIRN